MRRPDEVTDDCMAAGCRKRAAKGSTLCQAHLAALPAPMRGEDPDRRTVLLHAAYVLLAQQQDNLEVMSQTVVYDGAECDGLCLLQDIATELGIE